MLRSVIPAKLGNKSHTLGLHGPGVLHPRVVRSSSTPSTSRFSWVDKKGQNRTRLDGTGHRRVKSGQKRRGEDNICTSDSALQHSRRHVRSDAEIAVIWSFIIGSPVMCRAYKTHQQKCNSVDLRSGIPSTMLSTTVSSYPPRRPHPVGVSLRHA